MTETGPAEGPRPLRLDVITLVPERWNTCRSCEAMARAADLRLEPAERGEEGYPREWEERFDALATLLGEVAIRYGEKVRVRFWDPRTPLGLLFSLRHGALRYPAFVVQGRRVPGAGERAMGGVIPRIAERL